MASVYEINDQSLISYNDLLLVFQCQWTVACTRYEHKEGFYQ